MKAVIMAGGRGTRIASMFSDVPKPMIKIQDKPVLEYAIDCLKAQGITDIILTVSHMGHAIMDYFGDGSGDSPSSGQPFGVHIEYFFEEEPMGNAGALFRLRDKLTEDFLLINGDLIFDIDVTRLVQFHKDHHAAATLFTHPNSHPYDSGLIIADSDGRVTQWLTKEDERPLYYHNRVNAGIHVISPRILDMPIDMPRVDLDRQILKPLVPSGNMYCYDSPEYVRDMGTPERYEQVCRDLDTGIIQKKNLAKKQKAVFLDRDGTINRYVGFLRNIDDFELLDMAADAIKQINRSGYLAIVVTNQPVVARGEVSFRELDEIHAKMEMLLGKNGAYLDGVYLCPHHPHGGYAGEVKELKRECDCRKPKPGLLLQAASDFNIDMGKSWMVGDRENDILAGKAAGCRTALISSGQNNYGQSVSVSSLKDFADRYVSQGRS